jgi:hypothetical protein
MLPSCCRQCPAAAKLLLLLPPLSPVALPPPLPPPQCRQAAVGTKLMPLLHRGEESASSFSPQAVYPSPSMIDMLCVLCGVGYFYFYTQKSGILGQIYPTGHPTIPPKNTLTEVGYLRLETKDTHTK